MATNDPFESEYGANLPDIVDQRSGPAANVGAGITRWPDFGDVAATGPNVDIG